RRGGWRRCSRPTSAPRPADVAPAVESFFHAPTGTWSHVAHAGGDAVVVDPVLDFDAASGRIATDSARGLLEHLSQEGLRLHHVLETHAHADHLSASAFLRARTGAPVAIGTGIPPAGRERRAS